MPWEDAESQSRADGEAADTQSFSFDARGEEEPRRGTNRASTRGDRDDGGDTCRGVLVEDTSIEAMEEVIIEASSPPMDQVISPPTEPVDQTPAATQEFARVDCSVLRAIRREGVPSTNWNVAVLQQSSILC